MHGVHSSFCFLHGALGALSSRFRSEPNGERPMPRILAFAGSTRQESYNKRLIRLALQGARDAGVEVTLIDLRDLPLPLFDEDLEKAGTPENAKKLKQLFVEHQG